MKVLVYLPIDAIVKTWARRLEGDGHQVEITHTFSVFLKRLGWADWTLANATKNDAPRYWWKLLLSLLWARFKRRRVALFISIDPVDLCDRPLLRALLWAANRIAFRCPTLVVLLATRKHIARRYSLPERKVLAVYNCPDRETFVPGRTEKARDSDRPLTFLYHGELLWWHGLERFAPIYEEVRKHRKARLVVTGNFYPTVFRVFGLTASRREARVKRELAALLERDDVEYRGRVPLDELRRLMAEADFHVSLLNDRDLMATTELRTCLLEAMAAGMACLHAPTPALDPAIFRDRENIVLVDPNDPAGSAEKILSVAESPGTLEAIGRNAAHTVAEHFEMASQYKKALDRMAELLSQ